MGALDGNLLGITAGMGNEISVNDLLAKLDAIHGIDNAKNDAVTKLTSCRKQESELVAMFAERVRQLVNRAYPDYREDAKDEQALRAFLQGLPTKHEMRLRMRTMQFKTLNDAVVYGSNLEHVLKEERQQEKDRQNVSRSVNDDSVEEAVSFETLRKKLWIR
jgi:hypothetical protein